MGVPEAVLLRPVSDQGVGVERVVLVHQERGGVSPLVYCGGCVTFKSCSDVRDGFGI